MDDRSNACHDRQRAGSNLPSAQAVSHPKTELLFESSSLAPRANGWKKSTQQDTKVAWGALGTQTASTNTEGKAKHPFMHRTESVDYALVLEGEITLVLDKEEVLMREGDFSG